ncbi:MAG: hypothetical protein SFX74_01995 [Fimbriimonadaceae bacterium]|nr:hypothetical protein [Fimbriimonadaceae bacterium]
MAINHEEHEASRSRVIQISFILGLTVFSLIMNAMIRLRPVADQDVRISKTFEKPSSEAIQIRDFANRVQTTSFMLLPLCSSCSNSESYDLKQVMRLKSVPVFSFEPEPRLREQGLAERDMKRIGFIHAKFDLPESLALGKPKLVTVRKNGHVSIEELP